MRGVNGREGVTHKTKWRGGEEGGPGESKGKGKQALVNEKTPFGRRDTWERARNDNTRRKSMFGVGNQQTPKLRVVLRMRAPAQGMRERRLLSPPLLFSFFSIPGFL